MSKAKSMIALSNDKDLNHWKGLNMLSELMLAAFHAENEVEQLFCDVNYIPYLPIWRKKQVTSDTAVG